MQNEKIKLLLLEDNPAEARIIQEYIRDKNGDYSLNIVSSLENALVELNRAEYDLVISDLTVPDSFGVDTFLTLKAKHKSLPIIIMTNLEDQSVSENLLGAGAKDYIFKSNCNSSTFHDSVKKALKRAEVREKIKLNKEIKSDLYKYPEVSAELRCLYESIFHKASPELDLKLVFDETFKNQEDGIVMLGINQNDFEEIHRQVSSNILFKDEKFKENLLAAAYQYIYQLYC